MNLQIYKGTPRFSLRNRNSNKNIMGIIIIPTQQPKPTISASSSFFITTSTYSTFEGHYQFLFEKPNLGIYHSSAHKDFSDLAAAKFFLSLLKLSESFSVLLRISSNRYLLELVLVKKKNGSYPNIFEVMD